MLEQPYPHVILWKHLPICVHILYFVRLNKTGTSCHWNAWRSSVLFRRNVYTDKQKHNYQQFWWINYSHKQNKDFLTVRWHIFSYDTYGCMCTSFTHYTNKWFLSLFTDLRSFSHMAMQLIWDKWPVSLLVSGNESIVISLVTIIPVMEWVRENRVRRICMQTSMQHGMLFVHNME